jgi:hypothetical protein
LKPWVPFPEPKVINKDGEGKKKKETFQKLS